MSKRSKRRQKRILSLCVIGIAIALIFGVIGFIYVNKADNADVDLPNDTNTSQDANTEQDDYVLDESAADISNTGITFDELSKYYYSFTSGAGGWSDDFSIEKDGYFHGNYHDSEMGDTGDDYPDGSFYQCSYDGHFANIEKVDEFTCKMTMIDINVKPFEEYIEDGVRFIPSEPYALANAKEIEIYLPGKPVSEIDEEIQQWLGFAYMDNKPEKLDGIALVNVNENYGIMTYERMSVKEEAQNSYDAAKNSYEYYGDKLKDAETTAEMVELSGAQVRITDECLNDIWMLFKYNSDKDTFDKVLEEQRQWLKDRDASLEKYTFEEYGTLGAMDANEEQAEVTLKRCEELLKYFN